MAKRYAGYGVPCPFCGVRVSAYLSDPIAENRPDLHHDPDVCKKFWSRREDEGFLDDLRSKLRVWPEDENQAAKRIVDRLAELSGEPPEHEPPDAKSSGSEKRDREGD